MTAVFEGHLLGMHACFGKGRVVAFGWFVCLRLCETCSPGCLGCAQL